MLLPILLSCDIFTPGESIRIRYMEKSRVGFSFLKSRTMHSM